MPNSATRKTMSKTNEKAVSMAPPASLLDILHSDAAGLPITDMLRHAAMLCSSVGGGPLEDRLRLMADALDPFAGFPKNKKGKKTMSKTISKQAAGGRCGSPTRSAIPRDRWEWYGNAGHFCSADWCRFHLTTKIGKHVVSTVGEYYPPSEEKHKQDVGKPMPINNQNTYETMVFEVQGVCECGCGLPKHSGTEIVAAGYNNPKDATAGHYAMCERVASWPSKEVPE